VLQVGERKESIEATGEHNLGSEEQMCNRGKILTSVSAQDKALPRTHLSQPSGYLR
jgi:hypothetical protein